MTIAARKTIQSGDLAVLRGMWELTGTSPVGQPVALSGKSTEVARRQSNGNWLLVIDHPFGTGKL